MKFVFASAVALALPVATAGFAQTNPSASFATATASTGKWTYAATADGSEATFADAYNHPQLSVHCTRMTRRVSILRPVSVAATSIAIWTSDGSRSLPATYDAGAARLSVELATYDSLLDSMVSSRGRFVVSVSGQPALVVPPWPEIARVIEDCRA
jgi:hypothetical protein